MELLVAMAIFGILMVIVGGAMLSGFVGVQDIMSRTESQASAQIAGLGIGHLPRWLAAPEIATGRLVDLPLAETRQELPINIAWRSRQVGRALAWFLDRLADEATRRQLTTGI